MSNVPVLSCVGLSKTYSSGPTPVTVFNNLNLSVNAGESVAIVGASGSGKSTLLHLLGGLDALSSGDVQWRGQSIAALTDRARDDLRNRSLGFVYQFHHLINELSALDNVALPLRMRRESTSSARQAAAALLAKVGLAERAEHRPGELSGGERQRVAIARALVTAPACILADEPTGNLDSDNAERVFELLLSSVRDAGAALVLVTHAPTLARRCDRVFTLHHGALHNDLHE